MICGNCKSADVDVSHVKACCGASASPKASAADFRPMAVAEYVPDSDYALKSPDGVFAFYRVKRGKAGSRWAGFTFVSRLVGGPGEWATYPVKGPSKTGVLQGIAVNPKASALAFSREHGICACCGSPLSDPQSIATGFGPVCVQRFAA